MKYRLLKAAELQKIQVNDNGERLVYYGEKKVLVRESLVTMLDRVQHRLQQLHDVQLYVADGYRSPEFQERYFLEQFRLQCQKNLSIEELIEQTHCFVALPSVAGHPTGGAVDVTLTIDGEEISMGGKIADFNNPDLLPTFSQLILSEQSTWRLLLHDAMLAEGFAPYYGEWWHYSYGDREWAAFYGHSRTLYGSLISPGER